MSRGAGLCFSYERDASCRFGDDCRFVHSMAALKRAGKAHVPQGAPMEPAGGAMPPTGGAARTNRRKRQPRRRKKTAEAAGAPQAGPAKAEKDYECFQWRDSGNCEYAANCRFIHTTKGNRRFASAMASAGGATTTKTAKKKPRKARRKPAAKSADGATGDGKGNAGGTGDEPREPSKKYLRNQAFIEKKRAFRRQRAAKRAAARAAGFTGENQCFAFRDKGECKFGDECRFRHGANDERPLPQRAPRRPRKTEGGGDGAEDDAKEAPTVKKVDDICYQFYYSKKCAYADNCRFQHAVENADAETVELLDEAKKAIEAKASQADEEDGGDAGATGGVTSGGGPAESTGVEVSGATPSGDAPATTSAVEVAPVDGGDVKEAEAPSAMATETAGSGGGPAESAE